MCKSNLFLMATYFDVIFFSLLGGLFSLIGGALLLLKKDSAKKIAYYATPFAAGSLLAAVFLDLLPEGVEQEQASTVLAATMVGILLFFIAERFLHWFHHHHDDEDKKDPTTSLIIIGDTLHNALDGVAIASAFLINVPTGIVTTIAVALHEIPQEIGDFGLLLSKGMKRGRVLWFNVFSALATTVAAVLTFALGESEKLPVGLLLGLSAGFLLYIALSDILPSLHAKADNSQLLHTQTVLLLLGVMVVGIGIVLSHSFIDTNHSESANSQSQNSRYSVQIPNNSV
jgi:zinc and cadmium transporter